MDRASFNDGLLGFLDNSPTPFHTIKNISIMLENAGFERLYEELPWDLKQNHRYYVVRDDSSIIAFDYNTRSDYTIIGAHSDSPTFKVKPNPIKKEYGVVKLLCEPYGGMLLAPWFDRDLSLAGRVHFLDKKNIIQDVLIDFKDPIATIPSLAIHLDEKANKEKTFNKQNDLSPILLGEDDTFDFETFVKKQLQKEGYEDIEELYAFDLRLYDTQKSSFLGVNKEFIASSRLDNLLSCYVGLLVLCSSQLETSSKPYMLVITDHEEVGSETAIGADGSFFEQVYRRIFPSYESYVQSVRRSKFISCDNAHAIHPNFPQKHEPSHTPKMNAGVVIKINANQRYTSSSKTISQFLNVASALQIPTQKYVTRSDMGCGSTIGPIIASKIGLDGIDVGVPTLAMHSIRELAGIEDGYNLYRILLGYSAL